ncbi:sigma-70 family RNA polymerase sigma factor [uncultured Piscinibacter sp.]|uniref:sigma-70 family RNA polymerase sigma factor n=1 Tax=uncultured Piscinibacter sp. TaxID=1131835 RepID=UPI00261EDECD|nr:sigma-70 family RNA polymerase sigma factor [uncultured Piscinibacter sp.]
MSLALSAPASAASPVVDWAEMVAHRDALVRFAQRRLLDPALAEDVVHDVFEAVLSGRASFAGRAALRSWLTAILKHKIVDLVRQRAPLRSLEHGAGDDEAGGAYDVECPQPRPDEVAEQRERLAQTLVRIGTLPSGLRDAVQLRLIQDQATGEVCQALAISEDNLFVRLHRARRQLMA